MASWLLFSYYCKLLVTRILDGPFGRKETFIGLSCLCFYFSLYLISTYPPTFSSKNNSTNATSTDYSRSPTNFILLQKELIL